MGFWPAVLKTELWIWPFSCSIFLSLSIFFYPLKYPINFQTETATTLLILAKTIFLNFWDFVTSEYYILVPVKKNAYWLKYCIAVLWLDIWKVLSQKEVSFLPFHSRFYHPTLRIDFLNFCNKLVNINWKLKPLWIKPKETQNSRYSDHQLSADRPRSYYLYPFRFSSFFIGVPWLWCHPLNSLLFRLRYFCLGSFIGTKSSCHRISSNFSIGHFVQILLIHS